MVDRLIEVISGDPIIILRVTKNQGFLDGLIDKDNVPSSDIVSIKIPTAEANTKILKKLAIGDKIVSVLPYGHIEFDSYVRPGYGCYRITKKEKWETLYSLE